MEFHEVGRNLLEGLHEESLGIVEFHEVGRITETLTVYHYFSPTEFFPVLFQVEIIPPWGRGGRFWPKYLLLRTIVNFLVISPDPSQSIGIEIFKE